MPQIAKPKPHPGLLIAIAISVIILVQLLIFIGGFWREGIAVNGTVCSGIASWLAFRRGKTDVTTWLIPFCLFLFFVTTAVGYGIWLYSRKTIAIQSLIFWQSLVWFPLKNLLLHWVGYSLLSSSFCLYLIRCDADCELEHSIAKRKSGIRILFIATLVIALVLVVERLMANYSNFEKLGSSIFNELLMATYPFIEVLLPFGIAYAVASKGRHKLTGVAAIGFYVLLTLGLYVWSIITDPFGGSQIYSMIQHFVFVLVVRSLIIHAFLVSGYRFIVERRTPSAAIGNEESFDSILATENARQEIRYQH
jgi:hypothetical protein